MSIQDLIRSHIEERSLFLLEPVLPSDKRTRLMVVSPEIKEQIDGPWKNARHQIRAAKLRRWLERFVAGGVIALCLEPYRARNVYMGRLDKPSDEVWDIRCIDPKPALRVFGRFAAPDLFVALTWSPRSKPVDWSPKPPLGPWNSKEWNTEIRRSKSEWRKLFNTYAPHSGNNVNDYVTENAFAVGTEIG